MIATSAAIHQERKTRPRLDRFGLTMLEVIFAMVVILIGLVSVGLLIPLAGRQAADSYQITQGLAAGESALAMVNTARVSQPTIESPWCLRDDAAGIGYSIGSMKDAYDRVALTFPVPGDNVQAAVAQNEAIGIGFCIDPLFWGYQNRVATNPLPAPFVRTRFPCLDDFASPLTLSGTATRVPRLLRASLSDPRSPLEWLTQPTSLRLATMEGGDLVQVSPDRNRASAPLRAVYPALATGSPLVSSPVSADTTSWMMTVTPSESTPIIPLTITQQNFDGTIRSNRPVEIPRIYNLSVIVFSKRDVRDINPTMNPALGTLPSSERVLRVSDIASDALTSGTFTISVEGSPLINSRIRIGDWLMMSRYSSQELLPRVAANPTVIARQVHRWYRVVGVTGEDAFPRAIRVSGKPWNWTEGEINDRRERGLPVPTLPPSPATIETHAVLMKDVVQVYERQVELQ